MACEKFGDYAAALSLDPKAKPSAAFKKHAPGCADCSVIYQQWQSDAKLDTLLSRQFRSMNKEVRKQGTRLTPAMILARHQKQKSSFSPAEMLRNLSGSLTAIFSGRQLVLAGSFAVALIAVTVLIKNPGNNLMQNEVATSPSYPAESEPVVFGLTDEEQEQMLAEFKALDQRSDGSGIVAYEDTARVERSIVRHSSGRKRSAESLKNAKIIAMNDAVTEKESAAESEELDTMFQDVKKSESSEALVAEAEKKMKGNRENFTAIARAENRTEATDEEVTVAEAQHNKDMTVGKTVGNAKADADSGTTGGGKPKTEAEKLWKLAEDGKAGEKDLDRLTALTDKKDKAAMKKIAEYRVKLAEKRAAEKAAELKNR